jgi:orotate phosphoribosyltransferase
MIAKMEIAKKTAELLLQIKAIKLQPQDPFTWASGWNSPIYCDNRLSLSYPEVRKFLCDSLVSEIKEKYGKADAIAGVATGAIAMGIMVAEAMDLPFVYVRPEAKSHGRKNQIEGQLPENAKVIVVEDLISTGGSSLKAVAALREAGAEVLGMAALFTYGFQVSRDNFSESNCELFTLSNYEVLIEQAVASGYVSSEDQETLNNWRVAPDQWNK